LVVVVLDEVDPSGGLLEVVVVLLCDEFPAGGGTTTTEGEAASWTIVGFDLSWTTVVCPGSTTTSGWVGAHPPIVAAAIDAARMALV